MKTLWFAKRGDIFYFSHIEHQLNINEVPTSIPTGSVRNDKSMWKKKYVDEHDLKVFCEANNLLM